MTSKLDAFMQIHKSFCEADMQVPLAIYVDREVGWDLMRELESMCYVNDHAAPKPKSQSDGLMEVKYMGMIIRWHQAPRKDPHWVCPIGHKDCIENCGNYGCGN